MLRRSVSIGLIVAVTAFGVYRLKPSQYSNVDGWKRCYLATYPRSGTNWVRHLVQEATGVATGSVYAPERVNFTRQRAEPFDWGGYADLIGIRGTKRHASISDPILIMTHYPITALKKFDSSERRCVIRIVRNPIDALYSHSQFKYRAKPKKLPLSSRKWKRFLRKHAVEWKEHLVYWDEQPGVHTFRYEDLMENPAPVLQQILTLIGATFSDEDVTRACQAYPPQGSPSKHIEQYDQEDRRYLRETIGTELNRFNYRYASN
jgi:hypothetical protein